MCIHSIVDGTPFLKHHFPLSEDRIAKLVLPVDMTPQEAGRLSDFLDALALIPPRRARHWPFDSSTDSPPEDDRGDAVDLVDLDTDINADPEAST